MTPPLRTLRRAAARVTGRGAGSDAGTTAGTADAGTADTGTADARGVAEDAPRVARPGERVVTLVGRPGCHLCDDAREVVAAVCAELGVAWEERDITRDEELYRRYWEQIPVVLVDGRQHTFWRVDPERLRRALRE